MKIKRLIILGLLCFVFCGISAYAQIDSPPNIRTKFIDADINISLSGYIPRITGTISCTEGKITTINITNVTNNTVIANDTITAEQGVFNMSYTLPSLLNPKTYAVTINCSENGVNLANISVNIDSKLILVSVDGMLTTASNVELEIDAESTNTDLINKSDTYTGNKELSVTIPNLVASATFHLSAEGYEVTSLYPTVPTVTPPTTSGTPTVSANIANSGRYFTLAGCISSGAGKQITLLVTNPNQQIAYVNQVTSKENGMAVIYFALPEDALNGVYQVKVGGTDVNTPAELNFTYISSIIPPLPPTSGETAISAAVQRTGLEVWIAGIINTGASQLVTMIATDPDGNIAYVDQTVSGTNGVFIMNFILPDEPISGSYQLEISGEEVETPITLEFTYIDN